MSFEAQSEKWTKLAGLPSGPVPVESYRSQAFFELERERIFRRAWLVMGRIEELPEAHSYLVKDIEICDVQVLISRDGEGRVQAFHNVCSHRNNLLVNDREGCKRLHQCPYHGWTYGSDGSLRGVPDEKCFSGLDRTTAGLSKIATEVWNGWIFINLQDKLAITLEEFLGDFGPFLADMEYPNAETPIIVEAELDCNWKVVADAFSESYHIPIIHPETIGSTFSSDENRYARLLDARFFGPHRFCSMYGNPGYVPKETQKIEMLAYSQIATGNTIAAGQSRDMERFLANPNVNPTQTQSWSMDVNFIFPHFNLDTGPGGFWTHHFWPLSVDKTRHEVRFYVPKATTVRERFQQEHYLSRVIEVVTEDVANTARVQRGLRSGAKQSMVLQDNEALLRHSVHHVSKWAQSPTVEEAMKA
tara:strand:+ start:2992 stop:4242 length:1251 start_codon:yes stop_codon:yes gene_type:complete